MNVAHRLEEKQQNETEKSCTTHLRRENRPCPLRPNRRPRRQSLQRHQCRYKNANVKPKKQTNKKKLHTQKHETTYRTNACFHSGFSVPLMVRDFFFCEPAVTTTYGSLRPLSSEARREILRGDSTANNKQIACDRCARALALTARRKIAS